MIMTDTNARSGYVKPMPPTLYGIFDIVSRKDVLYSKANRINFIVSPRSVITTRSNILPKRVNDLSPDNLCVNVR